MTPEQYSAIQRIIGKLEGVSMALHGDIAAYQLAELAKLSEMIDQIRDESKNTGR